jgi:hypothetical protein
MDFYFDKEIDGYEGSLNVSRDDVEDLYALAQFVTQCVQGAGFNYVTDVGFEKDDGTLVFGDL